MATGLLATPAAAASGSTQASKAAATSASTTRPAVWANTPSASATKYKGACPVKVTFSTSVKVKTVASKTKVTYRWLRGDGSKSSVKSFTLKGKGTKSVTVKETGTFKRDTKGWQAIQVLSPRAATSGKKYFSVSCGNDWTVLNPPHKHKTSAQLWVDEGNCQATLIGRISTSGSRWVHYQWVVNGRVVESDAVRVNGSRKVSHVIRTHDDFRGWAVLKIVGGPSSNRDYFKIDCKDWNPSPRVSVSISAPSTYYGSCPVARTFTGTISASHRGEVKYRWIRNGVAGGWESVYFSGYGSQSRTVSDSWSTSASGEAKRSIEVYNGPSSATAETKVICKSATPTPTPTPKPLPVQTPEPAASLTPGNNW
ncbi:hypothetical protein [Streptosporangium subroseum]|nr:hypothetical protein [Streptosporangium subroseum]